MKGIWLASPVKIHLTKSKLSWVVCAMPLALCIAMLLSDNGKLEVNWGRKARVGRSSIVWLYGAFHIVHWSAPRVAGNGELELKIRFTSVNPNLSFSEGVSDLKKSGFYYSSGTFPVAGGIYLFDVGISLWYILILTIVPVLWKLNRLRHRKPDRAFPVITPNQRSL
jgi:hypothetical protein